VYAPLWCKSNFSFLEGASHAEELVEEAHRLGIGSIALTDRDGVYGMVRAHVKARELGVQLVCGAQVTVAAPGSQLTASPVSVVELPDGDAGAGGPSAPGRGRSRSTRRARRARRWSCSRPIAPAGPT
jgi:DNA polymerase III alpha subunit